MAWGGAEGTASQSDRIDVVQQDKDVLDETLQSNQETFTGISDGGKDSSHE